MVTESSTVELKFARLLERLLSAAEASLAAGEVETARAAAEEVLAVDPGNERATVVLGRLAEPLVHDPGQRALMTLLFSDLVGSTMLSEKVHPEQLRDLFALYRATAREAVERYGGYVLQYLGDGILAGFGYPEAHEDDARRAVLAGSDLVAAMASMRADLDRRVGVAPQVRVGLHTGCVLVTDLRDDRSVPERESIVGNAPNLAARIQGAAAPDQVVISDVTEHLVESEFFLSSLGVQDLKGISRPVEVFAVDRPRQAGDRLYADRYRRVVLVGRDEQRDTLVSAWQAVRSGSAVESGFVVAGEPGMGKTRLLADVVATVGTDGLVLGAGCLPYYSNVALWPVGRMLQGLVPADERGGDRQKWLVEHLTHVGLEPARSVPFLGPLIGVPADSAYPAPELDPSAVLDETLTQVVDWLAALAGQTPLMFVMEDLHWADPSTHELMGRLTARHAPGLLAVATTRDLTAIKWAVLATVLRLEALGDAAAVDLIDALTRGGPVSDEVRASIVERAEGNPLVVEELTRSFMESRDEAVPLRLQELFTWRLKSPLVDLRVAQTAATVGPVFDAEVVSAVLGDAASVATQMVVLANAGVIQPVDPQASIYRFRHSLLRDAAYETQVLDVRALTHARVAHALLAKGAQPAVVAEHLDRAGDASGAAQQYQFAGHAEQSRGAHREAAGLLTRALDLLVTLPESPERDISELTCLMLRSFSVSSMQGYGTPGVQADHRRAEVLAVRLGDRPEVMLPLTAIWGYWLVVAELGTARSLLDRMTALAGRVSLPGFEAVAPAACSAFQAFYEGRISEALVLQQQVLEAFPTPLPEEWVNPYWPMPHDPIAGSKINMACICAVRGESAEAERWERLALERAEAIGFPRGPWTLAFVKSFAAWIRRFRGEAAQAGALGAEVLAIGQEHGYAYWTLTGSIIVGAASPEPRGFASVEQAVDLMEAAGQKIMMAPNLAALSGLYEQVGDLAKATELVNRALEEVLKSGEHLHLPELLRQRAQYTLAQFGPNPGVVEDLEQAILVATEQGALVFRLRAAVALACLPDDIRPDPWRSTLTTARDAVPALLASEDTVNADRLLAPGPGAGRP